ncbi:hypothetical protein KP509_20G082000 [Ceratopteris richardii]|uniref:Uncharacterized protein n=1 Tax=Ceratopteris richardii TaxID=49495 RepID=A0A8T2SIK3_CERRI|nr:hypothetical protein KP509_20G082000 [Ceratopteris richardii]
MATYRKILAAIMLVALVAAFCMPMGDAIRDVGVKDVAEVSLAEQEQVMRLQEDMEAAKRHLLSYDPYYHHWYGGKGKP